MAYISFPDLREVGLLMYCLHSGHARGFFFRGIHSYPQVGRGHFILAFDSRAHAFATEANLRKRIVEGRVDCLLRMATFAFLDMFSYVFLLLDMLIFEGNHVSRLSHQSRRTFL